MGATRIVETEPDVDSSVQSDEPKKTKGRSGMIIDDGPQQNLTDFIISGRILFISGLALFIGIISVFVAIALLRLIGFFTSLFYSGRVSTSQIRDRLRADERLSPRLYPIVDADDCLAGVVTATESHEFSSNGSSNAEPMTVLDGIDEPAVAYPNEPLRVVVQRMAETGLSYQHDQWIPERVDSSGLTWHSDFPKHEPVPARMLVRVPA